MKKIISIASFMLVGLLLHVGIDLAVCADFSNMSTTELNNALISAVEKNKPETVQELVRAGANVNKEIKITGTHGSGEGGMDYMTIYTLLEYAAIYGYVAIVKELIKAGAVIYADHPYYSSYGEAALIGASTKGHVDVVKELIKAGADVNHADRGDAALIKASRKGHVDVVRELIKAGAYVNLTNKDGDTALMCAIKNHHFDVVQSILQSSEFHTGIWQRIKDLFSDSGIKSINYADKNGNTALMLAVQYAHFSYIKGNDAQYKRCVDSQRILNALLQTKGVDLLHVNNKGETVKTLLNEFEKNISNC